MASTKQVRKFINMIAPIAIAACNLRERKVLPSVCIAQAACESNWGTCRRMKDANALFGIKVGKNKVHFGRHWNGKAYSTKTKECYDGKTYISITDMFRSYDTVVDAVGDYYDMLGSCSRYEKCIGMTDAKQCITAIKNGGYATSPTYINTIMNIINKYNLTQYDLCMKDKPITIDHNPFTEPTEIITKGSNGEGAKWVQWYLWKFGLLTQNGQADVTQIDGIIGSKSENAISIAQSRLGLPATGIVTEVDREVFKKVC